MVWLTMWLLLINVFLLPWLQRMHYFGARKYVITGIGAVGCCPSQRNQNKDECNEEANKWSVKYNEALKTMLQGLKLELNGMDYSYVDVYNVFARFIETPSTFGTYKTMSLFTYVTIVLIGCFGTIDPT